MENKTIVVFGGTRGIGYGVAKLSASFGAKVVISGSTEASVAKSVKSLSTSKGKVTGYPVDLSDPRDEDLDDFFTKVGPFDDLVYTAGDGIPLVAVDQYKREDVMKAMQVRYFSMMSTVKAALKQINKKTGSITLTGGTAGFRPFKGWTIPASLCLAADGFAKGLAVDLAPIRCNIVHPGLVDTDLLHGFGHDFAEKLISEHKEKLLVQHVADSDECAEAYLYFIRSSYTTGQRSIIDGGGVYT